MTQSRPGPAGRTPRHLWVVGIIALLGLFDESLQSLLPYRNASALDWCFDVAAAAIVSVLFTLRTHFFQDRRPRPHA